MIMKLHVNGRMTWPQLTFQVLKLDECNHGVQHNLFFPVSGASIRLKTFEASLYSSKKPITGVEQRLLLKQLNTSE